jgi:hypothetical protein
MKDYEAIGLFCEDIREEKSGKFILIGLYTDNVNVTSIPGVFSKLAIYVRIHLNPAFDIREMTLVIRAPGQQEMNIGDFDPAIIEEQRKKGTVAPHIGLILQAVVSPFPVQAAGTIAAILKVNGEEKTVAVLNVRAMEKTKSEPSSPSISEPHASQPTSS